VGGRVVISTNAADHSARLNEIHDRAARELGFTPSQQSGFERFSLAELPLVRSVFPTVEVHPLPNAFVFPTTEAALRYYASGRVDAIDERLADGSHRPPLLEKAGAMIDEIIRQEGSFRVPKDAGYFLASIES
jgi:hypothetical protein